MPALKKSALKMPIFGKILENKYRMSLRRYAILLILGSLTLWSCPVGAEFPPRPAQLDWQILETAHIKLYHPEELEKIAALKLHQYEALLDSIRLHLYPYYQPERPLHIVLLDYDDPQFDRRSAIILRPSTAIYHPFQARIEPVPFAVPYQIYQQLLDQNLNPLWRYAYVPPDWVVFGFLDRELSEWGAYREMILRVAIRENAILSYDHMANVWESDNLLYQILALVQGHALLSYIAEFCCASSEEYAHFLTRLGRQGKSARDFYNEWWIEHQIDYFETHPHPPPITPGDWQCSRQGFLNVSPRWSPTGEQIAFASNQRYKLDKFDLFRMPLDGGTPECLIEDIDGAFCWGDDGTSIIYSKSTLNENLYPTLDLYRFDMVTNTHTRITTGKRANMPDVYGQQIAFTQYDAGNYNISVINVDGTHYRQLTHFEAGFAQNYRPRWSPDGEWIYFISYWGGRKTLWKIRPDGTDEQLVFECQGSIHDFYPSPVDSTIYFISDANRTFELYQLDLSTGQVWQLTEVDGGIFEINTDPTGESLLLTAYSQAGWHIYHQDRAALAPVPVQLCSGFSDEPSQLWRRHISFPQPYKPSWQIDYPRLTDRTRHTILFDRDYQSWTIGTVLNLHDNPIRLLRKTHIKGQVEYAFETEQVNFSLGYRRTLPAVDLEGTVYRAKNSLGRFGVDAAGQPVSDLESVSPTQTMAHQRNGGSLGIMYRRQSNQQLGLRIFGEEEHLNPEDVPATLALTPYNRLWGLKLDWRWDTIDLNQYDRDINPRRGRRVTALVETSQQAWGSDRDYTALRLDWREYMALPLPTHTLVIKMSGGVYLQKEAFTQRFLVGGFTGVGDLTDIRRQEGLRGFASARFAGNRFVVGTLEHRMSLYRPRVELFSFLPVMFPAFYVDSIYGSLFADGGQAWYDNIRRSEWQKGWRTGVGASLRIKIKIAHRYPLVLGIGLAHGFQAQRDFRLTYTANGAF